VDGIVGINEAFDVGFLVGTRVGGLLLVGEDEEGRLDGELVIFLEGEEVGFLVGMGVDFVDAKDTGDLEAGRTEGSPVVGFRVGIFVGLVVVAINEEESTVIPANP
jgi:hypothetical protein